MLNHQLAVAFILLQITVRVPTHFQKPFSILFQYLLNTQLKDFNTIIQLHFSNILVMNHNVKTSAVLSSVMTNKI